MHGKASATERDSRLPVVARRALQQRTCSSAGTAFVRSVALLAAWDPRPCVPIRHGLPWRTSCRGEQAARSAGDRWQQAVQLDSLRLPRLTLCHSGDQKRSAGQQQGGAVAHPLVHALPKTVSRMIAGTWRRAGAECTGVRQLEALQPWQI